LALNRTTQTALSKLFTWLWHFGNIRISRKIPAYFALSAPFAIPPVSTVAEMSNSPTP
jgi:hypothetical protein